MRVICKKFLWVAALAVALNCGTASAEMKPVASDLDIDGAKEIVFGSDDGNVYCLTGEGELLWKYDTCGDISSSPIVADLSGDGELEVLAGSSGRQLTDGTDIVECANYRGIVTGSPNWGGGRSERHFLTNQHDARIRQTGVITKISFYMAQKPATLETFYFEIWRKNERGLWDIISKENILSKLTAGETNNVTLNNPLAVIEGDYIGYGWECSGHGHYFKAVPGMDEASYYITNRSYTDNDFNWSSQTARHNYYLPIKAYMNSPAIVLIGDSIIAGHPYHYSYIESRYTDGVSSTIGYNLANILGCSYQNMGIGAQTTTLIASRFAKDVVNLKPKYAVIEGGVNDIGAGISQETFIDNWTSMLELCHVSNIMPVVVLIAPWTDGTDEQMRIRDEWNSSLKSLAASYGAIVVDTSEYVGQYRPGGDEGNLWDIRPEYDTDGVHFNPNGYMRIAEAIADAITGYDEGKTSYSLHCIANNGRPLWLYTIESWGGAYPSVSDVNDDGQAEILIESADDYFYCIRGEDGRLLWDYEQ